MWKVLKESKEMIFINVSLGVVIFRVVVIVEGVGFLVLFFFSLGLLLVVWMFILVLFFMWFICFRCFLVWILNFIINEF